MCIVSYGTLFRLLVYLSRTLLPIATRRVALAAAILLRERRRRNVLIACGVSGETSKAGNGNTSDDVRGCLRRRVGGVVAFEVYLGPSGSLVDKGSGGVD